MTLREWFWKFDRWFPSGSRVGWWRRDELHKPDRETELPQSMESADQEATAIERERQRRIADDKQD